MIIEILCCFKACKSPADYSDTAICHFAPISISEDMITLSLSSPGSGGQIGSAPPARNTATPASFSSLDMVSTMLFGYTINPTKRKAVFMDNQKFGQFILSLRKEKGWTQLELAEKLNVTDKAVSKWERGVSHS